MNTGVGIILSQEETGTRHLLISGPNLPGIKQTPHKWLFHQIICPPTGNGYLITEHLRNVMLWLLMILLQQQQMFLMYSSFLPIYRKFQLKEFSLILKIQIIIR